MPTTRRWSSLVVALGHYAGGQQQLIVKVWKQDVDGTPYLALDGPPPHNQNRSECVSFEVLGVVLASYHSLL